MQENGIILVVDDIQTIREPLVLMLELQGYTVDEAENGKQALEMLRARPFDLVLLDVMMPLMDGYETLQHMKADPALQHIPVIVISAVEGIESVVRCINLGAEDYLFKPFNKTLLKARIKSSLAKKQWHDLEKAYAARILQEQQKAEALLLNILPEPISQRLKNGDQIIVDTFDEVTVMFVDIVGFTELAATMSPSAMIMLLNRLFTRFDQLADRYELEKIKTIGDAYMTVGGLPLARADHAEAIADMALAVMAVVADWNQTYQPVQVRVGISTGPAIAGVIGKRKFAYDVWGDVVNMADRMQSHSLPDRIQVTEETYRKLKGSSNGRYQFEPRGMIDVKGKGMVPTYWLIPTDNEANISWPIPTRYETEV